MVIGQENWLSDLGSKRVKTVCVNKILLSVQTAYV